jgi:hypothetical protein
LRTLIDDILMCTSSKCHPVFLLFLANHLRRVSHMPASARPDRQEAAGKVADHPPKLRQHSLTPAKESSFSEQLTDMLNQEL